MSDPLIDRRGLMWAVFTARWVLGLIFFMAGWWKCFELTPLEHARQFFLGPYAESWIPRWWLWALGASIPLIELAAGAMLCLGLARRAACIALGAVLVTVTYGHLLHEPLFSISAHIFPRLALLLFVWLVPPQRDVLSADVLLARFSSTRRDQPE